MNAFLNVNVICLLAACLTVGTLRGADAGQWRVVNSAAGKVESANGRLTLTAAETPDPPVSAEMAIAPDGIRDQVGPNGMRLKLRVNTHGDPGVHFCFGIEFFSGDKCIRTFASGVESSYFGWTEKVLPFTPPREDFQEIRVFVRLLTGGILDVDAVRTAAADRTSPIKADNSFCRALELPPRHTYFLPDIPRKLRIEHSIPEGALRVTLSEIGKSRIGVWEVSGGGGTSEIELPVLPAGAYRLEYNWQGGKDVDCFRIRTAQTKGVSFDGKRRMRLDGKPFFPIGAYTSILTVEMLQVYRDAGFNTAVVRGHADTPESRYYAEKINECGMAAVITTRLGAGGRPENAAKEIDDLLRFASRFDRFIGISADELCWGKASLDKVRNFYELFFAVAPDFIVWQNHAPRMTGDDSRSSFAAVCRFSRLSEVTGVDIYPVPGGRQSHNNLPEKTLACVGKYTELADKSAWGEKPVWMILQAFSWDEYGGREVKVNPLPTFAELRFMAWDTVVHGARGIFWYHPLRTRMVWFTDFGRALTDVNREIAAFGEALSAGDQIPLPSAPENIVWYGTEYAGKRLFVAVNEDPERKSSFQLPLSGKFFVSPSGTPLDSDTVTLEPYGVLILYSEPLTIPPASTPKRRFTDAELTIPGAWVAHPQFVKTPRKKVFFRQEFTLPEQVGGGVLKVTADEVVTIAVNEKPIPYTFDSKRTLVRVDIGAYLKPGKNVVSGTLWNAGGPAGVIFSITAGDVTVVSGKETLFSENGAGGWVPAYSHGASPVKPWYLPAAVFDIGVPGRFAPQELHANGD